MVTEISTDPPKKHLSQEKNAARQEKNFSTLRKMPGA
jgi:hypothetical protein